MNGYRISIFRPPAVRPGRVASNWLIYLVQYPPSTKMSVPVVYEAASLAR